MTDKTTRDSLKLLAKTLLTKIENKKYAEFDNGKRSELLENFTSHLNRNIVTDDDITEKVKSEIGSRADAIADQNITESSAFVSRKKALKAELSEHELRGFYFPNTIRAVGISVCNFLLNNKNVEEVYESDEAIQKLVVDTIQNFDPSKIA